MRAGLVKAFLVAGVCAAGTVLLWMAIARASDQQVARIAEAESYAARSQLIRGIDTVLSALRNVRLYWLAVGYLPERHWTTDAGIELEHFEGIEMILWDDPERDVRYMRTPETPEFTHRPTDDEWASYRDLVEVARSSDETRIVGPVRSESGSVEMTVVVTGLEPSSGRLAAVIDVDKMLDRLLQDESPGFAVQVFDGERLIYERGEADPAAPPNWIRGGLIRSSLGSLWRVNHLPTAEMLESYTTPATDLTLLLGLVVSILMGTLTFENGRARRRAQAAELAETQVSELNRDLELLVEDRTRELSARTSDLQTLTDSVAHDLRNPLNALSINMELLEDSAEVDREQLTKVLGRMTPCIDQMTDVLDRLLGLSTLANATFERQSIDMTELVKSIYEDLAATEPPAAVRFEVGDLPKANADRILTHVLLLNLISNALKYSRGKDDRFIEVGHEMQDDEVVYYVRDNGVGFGKDQAEKIFSAFTRLDEEHTQEGVGLGLTLARKVIRRHDGRIWAQSEPGQGATFYFVLSPGNSDDNDSG